MLIPSPSCIILLFMKSCLVGIPFSTRPDYYIEDKWLSCNKPMGYSTSLYGLAVEHWILPVVTLFEVVFQWRTHDLSLDSALKIEKPEHNSLEQCMWNVIGEIKNIDSESNDNKPDCITVSSCWIVRQLWDKLDLILYQDEIVLPKPLRQLHNNRQEDIAVYRWD